MDGNSTPSALSTDAGLKSLRLGPSSNEKTLMLVVSCASIVGASTIMVCYCTIRSLISQWRGLLVWLSFFDLLQALFYVSIVFFNYDAFDPGLCAAVALGNVVSSTGSYLTTACFSYLVGDIVSSTPANEDKQRRMSIVFHVIFLGFPVFAASVAFGLHLYFGGVLTVDHDQFGCYINHHYAYLRWIVTYIPLVVSWSCVVWFNVTSYRRLWSVSRSASFSQLRGEEHMDSPSTTTEESERRRSVSRDKSSAMPTIRNVMWKLQLIPLGFIILRLPDISYRVSELLPQIHLDPRQGFGAMLTVLQSALNPAQGFWNGILFVFSSNQVREKFMLACCKPRFSRDDMQNVSVNHSRIKLSSASSEGQHSEYGALDEREY